MLFQVMIDNVGDFSSFCAFQCIFRLVCIPLVAQKQKLGEVGNWMVICQEYSHQKLLKS